MEADLEWKSEKGWQTEVSSWRYFNEMVHWVTQVTPEMARADWTDKWIVIHSFIKKWILDSFDILLNF